MDKPTRSATAIWLIGQPSATLKTTVLPSKREAMSLLMHYKEVGKQKIREALNSTAIDAMKIWQTARIPTSLKNKVVKKLNIIYDEWIKLKKNKENKKKQSYNLLNKQDEWNKYLDKLFVIAHVNALNIIDISEDKEF